LLAAFRREATGEKQQERSNRREVEENLE